MSRNFSEIMKDNEMQWVKMGVRESTMDLTEQFPFEKRGIAKGYKIDEMLVMVGKIYQTTKAEISGLFELNEAYLIVQAFTGFAYTAEMEDKPVLLSNVNSVIFYDGLDDMFSVDRDKLLEKLQKLTEAQCFAIIRMTFEIIYSEKNRSKDIDLEELVKGVFGIN